MGENGSLRTTACNAMRWAGLGVGRRACEERGLWPPPAHGGAGLFPLLPPEQQLSQVTFKMMLEYNVSAARCGRSSEGAGDAPGTDANMRRGFWLCAALAEAGGLWCSGAKLGPLKHLLSVLSMISSPEKLGQLLASKRVSLYQQLWFRWWGSW